MHRKKSIGEPISMRRYKWTRCKYLHKAITAREGSVAEEGVSMPIRYEPEAIGNLVEHSAHIRGPVVGCAPWARVSLMQGRTAVFDKYSGDTRRRWRCSKMLNVVSDTAKARWNAMPFAMREEEIVCIHGVSLILHLSLSRSRIRSWYRWIVDAGEWPMGLRIGSANRAG